MAFETTVKLLRAKGTPEQMRAYHAKFAKKVLAKHLSKRDDKPNMVRYVDGTEGQPEEAVKLGGVIRYEFHQVGRIAEAALEKAVELSPVKSGAYRTAWFLMVDGKKVDEVPAGAREVILTNNVPYHRKLEMTVNQGELRKVRVRKPPGIVERVRQALLSQYGDTFDASIAFIEIPGGYTLAGTRGKRRARKAAGSTMTYPALIIRTR